MIRPLTCVLGIALFAAQPLAAQDRPSLMERGAQMFLEGLLREMEPAIDEMQDLAGRVGPAMRDFLQAMGPKLGEVIDQVEDWSAYHPPEILDNGDIIIRRKKTPPEPKGEEIEL